MIYTVTLNPSIDYIAATDQFQEGKLNRVKREVFFPGGKGINVSIVLHNLGITSTALGFVAGFTGEQIENRLNGMQIKTDFIHLKDGISRINVKIKSDQETELNGMGPRICPKEVDKLMKQLCKLKAGDVLVLAGSVPESIADHIYEDICKQLSEKEIRIVVDTSGKLLWNVLPYHPYLIKPNHHELGELFGVTIQNTEEAVKYAEKLQELGTRNVIVSMAEKGAVYLNEKGSVYIQEAPEGKVINSVGAGDSVVAGFLAALELAPLYGPKYKDDDSFAFRFGVCTGSASAFREDMAEKADVETLMEEIHLL